MNTTKLHIKSTLLTAFLLITFGFFQFSTAQKVQSDFEIVKSFNDSYNEIQNKLDTVSSVSGAKALVNQVNKLENKFSTHSQLLNKALYPQTFEEQINKLSAQTKSTLKHLQTIAEQRKKLNRLTGNVNDFEKKFVKLQRKTDSLQKLLSRQNQRSQQLSRAVREYRNNVSERDQLILSFVDSVVTNYRHLDTQALQELSMAYQESRKNIDSNPLKLIQSIAQSNIEFLNSTQTLSTNDYLRMYQVQQKFREMWNTVGNKIVRIYKPKKSGEAIQSEIKGALDEWETKVTDETWKSINRSFSESGIELSEFGDSKGFYNSLTSYLDNQIKNGNRKAYENFSSFWNNTVKGEWAGSMTGSDILTYEQISNVDQQLNKWDDKSAPISYFWPVLLAVAVLIIIVLGIMLARAKS